MTDNTTSDQIQNNCPLWHPELCALPSPALHHYGDAGVDAPCGVGVRLRRALPAQLDTAAAAVCHQEEAEDGGNIQAQCGGEETDGSGGIWETRPASAAAAAQRGTTHMMDAALHAFFLLSLCKPLDQLLLVSNEALLLIAWDYLRLYSAPWIFT